MRSKRFLQLLKESSGFTLLELTIVFTIIASIGGLGFAAFTNFSTRQMLEQTAQDLKSGIDQTKFAAISRTKPVACPATSSLYSYAIIVCAVGGATACSTGNLYEIRPQCTPNPVPSPMPMVKQGNSKIAVTVSGCGPAASPNYNAILFSPQIGLVRKTGCKILLTNTETNETKSICVDSGGNSIVQNDPCI